jgi:hypothetical protein
VGSNSNYLLGVSAISRTNAWAVGTDLNTLIEQWNGTGWSIVTSPNVGSVSNVLTAVSADGAADAWAAGSFAGSDYVPRTLVEHFC